MINIHGLLVGPFVLLSFHPSLDLDDGEKKERSLEESETDVIFGAVQEDKRGADIAQHDAVRKLCLHGAPRI